MNIAEFIQYITSYRDALIEYIKTRLDNFEKDFGNPRPPLTEQSMPEDAPVYLSPRQIRAILAEIMLCNATLQKLIDYRDFYSREAIGSVDQYIHKQGNDNHFLDTYNRRA